MDRYELATHITTTYVCLTDFPWASDPLCQVFRHKDSKKWFGLVMPQIPKKKLGLEEDGAFDVLNAKCAEDVLCSILQEPGIFPAYHMNRDHWVSIALDGSASDETIRFLVDVSYELTKTKKKRNAT